MLDQPRRMSSSSLISRSLSEERPVTALWGEQRQPPPQLPPTSQTPAALLPLRAISLCTAAACTPLAAETPGGAEGFPMAQGHPTAQGRASPAGAPWGHPGAPPSAFPTPGACWGSSSCVQGRGCVSAGCELGTGTRRCVLQEDDDCLEHLVLLRTVRRAARLGARSAAPGSSCHGALPGSAGLPGGWRQGRAARGGRGVEEHVRRLQAGAHRVAARLGAPHGKGRAARGRGGSLAWESPGLGVGAAQGSPGSAGGFFFFWLCLQTSLLCPNEMGQRSPRPAAVAGFALCWGWGRAGDGLGVLRALFFCRSASKAWSLSLRSPSCWSVELGRSISAGSTSPVSPAWGAGPGWHRGRSLSPAGALEAAPPRAAASPFPSGG